MLDTDPNIPSDQLLRNIVHATQQPHFPGLALVPFATLMVKIAGEAEVTITKLQDHITHLDEKNGKLQFWVVALAVVSLVSTLVQTGIAVVTLQAPQQAIPPPATPATTATAAAVINAVSKPATAKEGATLAAPPAQKKP
jgi:hypothetical protein